MRLVPSIFILGVATFSALAAEVSSTNGTATFNKDVLPILQRNCQGCHRPGQIAPMSFLTYDSTRPWAKAIKTAVAMRKMPPWFADPQYGHFANDRSLKQAEIDTLVKWADTGAAQGDPKDAPSAIQWPENGWTTKPDMVMKGMPYPVPAAPAKNVIEWVNVLTPGNFTKDTWVTSIEIRPTEYSVTHHLCSSFVPHRENAKYNIPVWVDKQRDEAGVEVAPSERQLTLPTADGKGRVVAHEGPPAGDGPGGVGIGFVCYVPGRSLHDFRPHHAALRVPAGYDISWQLHYTPNGKDVTDIPELGLTTMDHAPERVMIESFGGGANPATFAIPPNDPNWAPDPSNIVFHEDAELVWLAPHMHLRGKDMTYTLIYPDGKSQVVLSVPHYDFNWQLGYELAEPIKIPKGSKLVVVAHYDNSANNKYNPDPTRTVYQGNMTWEEMFTPFFAVTVEKGVNPMKVVTIPFPAANGGA